jgi:hypothetical protein
MPRTEGQSSFDPEAAPRLVTRLAVINHLGRVDHLWAQSFSEDFQGFLHPLGVVVLIQTRHPLAVDSVKATYAEELKAFEPQAVLVVEPGDGIINAQGNTLRRGFEASLMPYPLEGNRRKIVWRSGTTLYPAGVFLVKSDFRALAKEWTGQLVADGILPPPRLVSPLPEASATAKAPSPNPYRPPGVIPLLSDEPRKPDGEVEEKPRIKLKPIRPLF